MSFACGESRPSTVGETATGTRVVNDLGGAAAPNPLFVFTEGVRTQGVTFLVDGRPEGRRGTGTTMTNFVADTETAVAAAEERGTGAACAAAVGDTTSSGVVGG